MQNIQLQISIDSTSVDGWYFKLSLVDFKQRINNLVDLVTGSSQCVNNRYIKCTLPYTVIDVLKPDTEPENFYLLSLWFNSTLSEVVLIHIHSTTGGLSYVPISLGAPTSVPTELETFCPFILDVLNSVLYYYYNGEWIGLSNSKEFVDEVTAVHTLLVVKNNQLVLREL